MTYFTDLTCNHCDKTFKAKQKYKYCYDCLMDFREKYEFLNCDTCKKSFKRDRSKNYTTCYPCHTKK